MKTRSICSTILLAMLILALPTHPGLAQSAPLSLHLEQADLTAFPQVVLHLSAWDASGLPLAGLTPAGFTLQEDGGAGFHPTLVQEDTNAPLSVVLVLDMSGSMTGQPLADAKVAAARFLDRLAPGDRAALVAFSESVNPDPAQPDLRREMAFTTDLAPMYDLVSALQAGGGTPLYDAMTKAVRLAAALPPGHRAVLLLSDGRNDPAEVGDPQEALQLARESNLPVFVIGLGTEVDEAYLRGLADGTGGLFRSTPKSSELASLFTDMANLLKTQYLLTYSSSLEADGGNHTLAVTLNTSAGTGSANLAFGPLPLQPTPTPTQVQVATALPATPVPPPPTAVPTPVIKESHSFIENNWGWILAAILAIGLGLWLSQRKTHRPRPKPEVCTQCGYDLTGIPGACPQCGGTKRLPRPRK